MKKLIVLLALLGMGARLPAQVREDGGSLQVYVLRLNRAAVPSAQYDVGIILEQVDPENAEARAREISKNGILSGLDYYPPHMVQRIRIYLSPAPGAVR